MDFGIGSSEVRLERNELRVLASDTRVDILKNLKQRNYTVSELSKRLGHSKSTMHEHVNKLSEAGLVEKADNYTNKWVYYRLSRKGKSLFNDGQRRVVVILASVLLVVGLFQLSVFFTSFHLLGGQPLLAPAAEEKMLGSEVPQISEMRVPSPSEEKQLAVPEEADSAEELDESALREPASEAEQEIPYYLAGGIGFIAAAFMLAHYYRGMPPIKALKK